jgi:hypothetical protein
MRRLSRRHWLPRQRAQLVPGQIELQPGGGKLVRHRDRSVALMLRAIINNFAFNFVSLLTQMQGLAK